MLLNNIKFFYASVGEPLNKEAWQWYHSVVGEKRCTVVDTYWQTGSYVRVCSKQCLYFLVCSIYIIIIRVHFGYIKGLLNFSAYYQVSVHASTILYLFRNTRFSAKGVICSILYKRYENSFLALYWIMCSVNCFCNSATETGGITITPRPGPDNNPPKPGFPTRPFWGLHPAILNDKVCRVN